jgi:hypothetical protein
MNDDLPTNKLGHHAAKPVTKEGATEQEANPNQNPPPSVPLIGAHINPSQPEPNETNASGKKPFPWKLVAEIIGFAAGLVLLLINGGMLYESHETRLTAERAWVYAEILPNSLRHESTNYFFDVKFVNTGKTPAFITGSYNSLAADTNHIPTFDVTQIGVSLLLIPYSEPIAASANSIQTVSTAAIPDFVIEGYNSRFPVFGYGTVWYDDIFGKHHWIQFCYRLTEGGKYTSAMQFHASCDKETE